MQLKYDNQVKNKVIVIHLETVNFTKKENVALEKFGEPVVKLDRLYNGLFPVSIERRIKSGFKIRVKFDGNEELGLASASANEFIDEIKELLAEEMRVLMEKLSDLEVEFKSGSGFYDLSY